MGSKAEASSSGGHRVWTFLNSPFALFLLSSILITGVGRLYTDYRISAQAERDRAVAAEGALTELDRRVVVAEHYAARLKHPGIQPQARGRAGALVGGVLNPMDAPGGTEFGKYDGMILMNLLDRRLGAPQDLAVRTAILDTGSIWFDSGLDDYRRAAEAVRLLRLYIEDRRARLDQADASAIGQRSAALDKQGKIYLASRDRHSLAHEPIGAERTDAQPMGDRAAEGLAPVNPASAASLTNGTANPGSSGN